MKKYLLATSFIFALAACNNNSEGTGTNDSVGVKGNSDSASGGIITTVIDSSTSINQSTGSLHDSVGVLKTDTSKVDSSKMKK